MVLMTRALKAFSQASGMTANNDKSAIYFGNILDDTYKNVTGDWVQEGLLSFSLLGCSYTSKRVLFADCDVLVNKVFNIILC